MFNIVYLRDPDPQRWDIQQPGSATILVATQPDLTHAASQVMVANSLCRLGWVVFATDDIALEPTIGWHNAHGHYECRLHRPWYQSLRGAPRIGLRSTRSADAVVAGLFDNPYFDWSQRSQRVAVYPQPTPSIDYAGVRGWFNPDQYRDAAALAQICPGVDGDWLEVPSNVAPEDLFRSETTTAPWTARSTSAEGLRLFMQQAAT